MALDYLFIMCLLHAYICPCILYRVFYLATRAREFPLTNLFNMPKK